MPWVLKHSYAPRHVVHFEMSPPCADIRPPRSYFDERGIAGPNVARTGLPVEEQYWPKTARLKRDRKSLPSIVGFCSYPGFPEAWVQEIEKIEPGLHQFRPVTILGKDGGSTDFVYYAVNVQTILDNVVDFSKTTAPCSEEYGSRWVQPPGPGVAGKVVFYKERIAGKHLWYSKEIASYALTISDLLYERLSSRSLIDGLICYQMMEE